MYTATTLDKYLLPLSDTLARSNFRIDVKCLEKNRFAARGFFYFDQEQENFILGSFSGFLVINKRKTPSEYASAHEACSEFRVSLTLIYERIKCSPQPISSHGAAV